MLVIDDSHYEIRVPIQEKTLHIVHILDLMTLEELDRPNKQSTRGKISRILAAKVACEETVKQKQGDVLLRKKKQKK